MSATAAGLGVCLGVGITLHPAALLPFHQAKMRTQFILGTWSFSLLASADSQFVPKRAAHPQFRAVCSLCRKPAFS